MRWHHKPKQSNWGEFGPDDEIGRLNLITPEKVLQGIAEVREGRTFCLSLPLDYPGGNVLHSARHPPKRRATATANGVQRYLLRLSGEDPDLTDVVCDDQVTFTRNTPPNGIRSRISGRSSTPTAMAWPRRSSTTGGAAASTS